MTPELQSKMILWRSKAVDGTLSQEELKEAMAALRGARKSAASSTTAAKAKKAKAAVPSADDLLKEMGMEDE